MGAKALQIPGSCCSSTTTCCTDKDGLPKELHMNAGYDAPGMAMAEALTEGVMTPGIALDVLGDEAHEDVVIGSGAAASGSSKFNGLWRDKDYAHMIKGAALVWGDDTVTGLQIDDLDTSVSMLFNKSTLTGSLNGNRLEWSDGDNWTRITLDGVWDDYGHCHQIQSEQLFWSNGTSTTLLLSGWSGVSMVFNSAHVRGTLDLTGDTILWSDGDVWQRAGVDGRWQPAAEKGEEPKISTIEGTTLTLSTGRKLQLAKDGRCKVSVSIDGQVFEGELNDVGTELKWSDGKVWTRISRPAEVISP